MNIPCFLKNALWLLPISWEILQLCQSRWINLTTLIYDNLPVMATRKIQAKKKSANEWSRLRLQNSLAARTIGSGCDGISREPMWCDDVKESNSISPTFQFPWNYFKFHKTISSSIKLYVFNFEGWKASSKLYLSSIKLTMKSRNWDDRWYSS